LKFLFAKKNPTFSLSHIGHFPLLFITSPNTRQKHGALIVNKSQHFHVCSSAVAVNLQTDLYSRARTHAHTHTEAAVKLMGWVKDPLGLFHPINVIFQIHKKFVGKKQDEVAR
jgi:hypothetical protein